MILNKLNFYYQSLFTSYYWIMKNKYLDEKDEFSEYIDEIHENDRRREELVVLKDNFENQKEVNRRMRFYLIDWLLKVHLKFKRDTNDCEDVFFNSIYLLDRLFMAIDIPKNKLQFTAITCYFIMGKTIPDISDHMTSKEAVKELEGSIRTEELFDYEKYILEKVDYQFDVPLLNTFIDLYSHSLHLRESTIELIQYIAYIVLLHMDYVHYKSSLLATSIIYCARKINSDGTPFCSVLKTNSGYTKSDKKKCCQWVCKMILRILNKGRNTQIFGLINKNKKIMDKLNHFHKIYN